MQPAHLVLLQWGDLYVRGRGASHGMPAHECDVQSVPIEGIARARPC